MPVHLEWFAEEVAKEREVFMLESLARIRQPCWPQAQGFDDTPLAHFVRRQSSTSMARDL